MREYVKPLFVIALGLAFTAVMHAQKFEVTPHVGYKFGGYIPVTSGENDVTKLEFKDSYSLGVNVGYNFTKHFGAEFLWNRQLTEARGFLAGGGELATRPDMEIDGYFGNVLYHFRGEDAKLRPFVLGGIGATRLADGDSSATRISFNLGGGVKYFVCNNMGIRLQMRWNPTHLYSESAGVWCNWWGWCYDIPNDHYMNQGEASVGWIFRF